MKRRSLPIWMLRDEPAFLCIIFSFWPLVILLITSVRRAMCGKKMGESFYDGLSVMLAHAKARLAFALRRQAYRRLRWNPRLVPFDLIHACDNWVGSVECYRNCSKAIRDMNAVVEAYIADIRAQYRISERDLVAHGSTDARHSRAAHHELVGAAPSSRAASPFALILSSARTSKDERAYAHARGPSLARVSAQNQPQPNSAHPRLRSRPRASRKSAPASSLSA
jgi:hypothetical protein